MALLRYFQAQASSPTAEETTLSDTVTQSANAAVLREVQVKRPRKHKAYTAFTAEQRATIGEYASEHGNAAAIRDFTLSIRWTGNATLLRSRKFYNHCYARKCTRKCLTVLLLYWTRVPRQSIWPSSTSMKACRKLLDNV